MAKLDLGDYELELVLDEIRPDILQYDYLLTIMCSGVNVIAPWRKLAHKEDEEWGTFFISTSIPFDKHFRPLITDEWPIKLTDNEEGNFMTIIAYPSSFLVAVEQSPWISPWEGVLTDLAEAAENRWTDKENLRFGKNMPKKFHLDRDSQMEKVRFSFQFSNATMGIPPGNYRVTDGWGNMAFDAYVDYDALERFLNELEAERKAFKGQDETEE